MLVRYEIMTKMIDEEDANRLADMIFDFVENKLGHECALEIINGSTEETISGIFMDVNGQHNTKRDIYNEHKEA